jgi:hypothetical protein
MMSKRLHRAERQSRRDAARRKAKGRVKHALQFRCWIDRTRRNSPRRAPAFNPFAPTRHERLELTDDQLERWFGNSGYR